MNKLQLNIIFLLSIFLCGQSSSFGQERELIDKVIAKVGIETILLSDVESQYNYTLEQQGGIDTPDLKCEIFRSLIGQKLIVHQAKLDSVSISDEEIEASLDFRIQQVLRQMNGDETFFEEYYNMTVAEMRENLREDLNQQMLAERMQNNVINEVEITPKEVKEFFHSIPTDSLPYLNAEVELAEIVVKPEVNPEEKTKALKKVIELRNRIVIEGEDFAEIAKIHSDDPGSGSQGGNLGFAERGTFVPEFEAVAYSLAKGEISEPIETEFGYHILELLERRGNKINIRHILVKPGITEADYENAVITLDTIKAKIERGDLDFARAVKSYSYEKIPSFNNNGMLQNPNTGKTNFETAELPNEIYFAIEDLEVGQISEPLEYQLPTGEKYYRIVRLLSKIKPHQVNLDEDYSKLQRFAKESKKSEYFAKWIDEKFKTTFIKIEEGYIDCPDLMNLLN